jgi:predicted metal-dependent peptidase
MKNKTTEEQNPPRVFSRTEWERIGESLENYHSIFQKFWGMGKPVFSYDIPTAAVAFDKVGQCIDFIINPKFWDGLTEEQRLFIICHEVTHVLFYHGVRTAGLKTKNERIISNLALDVVVNHFLTESLDFNRAAVDPENKYCWIDTVFQDPKTRPMTGETFEYYYALLKKEIENNPKSKAMGMSSLDDHDCLDSFFDTSFEETMKETMNKTEEEAIGSTPKMRETAKKELEQGTKANGDKSKSSKPAGISPGNSWIIAKTVKAPPKKKWETVIKNWSLKYLEEKLGDQWQKPHRRLVNMPKDFLIPAEHELDEYEKKRIPVYFFLDTSGSCAHLADRFFAAAESLPEDKFALRLCCFDTKVYETDIKSKKLYGFGGTSFECIEKYIQSKIKSTKSYPEAVFVLTDGYGDTVSPEIPSRWHWFLSEDYKNYIPKLSKTFNLKDFE